MQLSKLLILPALLLVGLTAGNASAQGYIVGTPVPAYQQPIYTQAPPAGSSLKSAPVLSSSTCQCPQPGNGACKCKNLSCKIQLPYDCKKETGPTRTPIPCKIYGKIPVFEYYADCLEKHCDFRYDTEVPEVHCVCEKCVEIGTKLIQCLPGCCFSVCIPQNQCTTKSVQCKLGCKTMPMELWKRVENKQTRYDVYVINNPSVESSDHAGGMPSKWVIMHCGTKEQFLARFPNAVCSDGKPILADNETSKDAKPEATTADVKLEMVVDQEQLASYLQQRSQIEESTTANDSKTETETETAKEDKS